MSADFLKHQAMRFCLSPIGIAHHSAKWSRVLISGRGVVIRFLIGTLVRGVAWLWRSYIEFVFSGQQWNNFFQASVCKIWRVALLWLHYCYACFRSIIVLSGSSEDIFNRLPHRRISSEKLLWRCIFKTSKSNLSTCCTIARSMCIAYSSTQQLFAASERLFYMGSLCSSFCLCKVSCIFKASETIAVAFLVRNWLNTLLWRWICATLFSMYSIMAAVWFRYCASMLEYSQFLMPNMSIVKGILSLAKGLKWVDMKTWLITSASVFNSIRLNCHTWLYSSLHQVKPEYGGIIAPS